MDQKQIDRLNELAKKAKSPEGLTQWEVDERAALRREYIDAVLGSLQGQLDHCALPGFQLQFLLGEALNLHRRDIRAIFRQQDFIVPKACLIPDI